MPPTPAVHDLLHDKDATIEALMARVQQLETGAQGVLNTSPHIRTQQTPERYNADATCKLGVRFETLSQHEGRTATRTKVDVWQPGAMLTYDFGAADVSIEVGELSGAVRIALPYQTEKFASRTLSLRLSALDWDEEPAVRFSVTNIDSSPSISCVPSLPFPPPFVPTPPPTAPSPPPGAGHDVCFLGGAAYFAQLPCFGVCKLHLQLERWQPGVALTINFAFDRTATSELRMRAVVPPSAARAMGATRHSLIVELRELPSYSVAPRLALELQVERPQE